MSEVLIDWSIPTLILPVGPPGSGKSFLARTMVQAGFIPDDAIVCPDEYRKILTGDMQNQNANGDAFAIAHRIIESRFKFGQHVYFDATNMLRIKKLFELGSEYRHNILVLESETSDEICLERNERRERVVPLDVMKIMLGRRNHANQQLLDLREQGYDFIWMTIEDMIDQASDVIFEQKYALPAPFSEGLNNNIQLPPFYREIQEPENDNNNV